MASARVEDQIERDNIEEAALLDQENKHEGNILKNGNFKEQNLTSSTSTRSQPGGKEQTSEKTADIPPVNNQQDEKEDHKRYGLCRSGKCISHWACRDPLLHRTSVCDRLTELLHTRRRYDLCQLILKLLTLTAILCFASMVCYQYGLTKCEMTKMTNKPAASKQMNDTGSDTSGATTKDTSGATTEATTNVAPETLSDDNQDEEQDDDFKTSDEYHQHERPGFASGIHKEKTGTEQKQTDQDFTFDEKNNDSDDEKNNDSDDEDKNYS